MSVYRPKASTGRDPIGKFHGFFRSPQQQLSDRACDNVSRAMSFDPKIRNSPQPLRLPQAKSTTAEKPAVSAPKREGVPSLGARRGQLLRARRRRAVSGTRRGAAVRGGVADDSGRRLKRGGVADDSVGRSVPGEVADDSGFAARRGGVADDSIGRAVTPARPSRAGVKPKKGVPDDSIGRAIRKKGVPDDCIGDSVRDSLVGPVDNPQYVKARDALYAQLESPSYLASAGRSGVGDLIRAKVLQSSVFHKLPTAQQASLAERHEPPRRRRPAPLGRAGRAGARGADGQGRRGQDAHLQPGAAGHPAAELDARGRRRRRRSC